MRRLFWVALLLGACSEHDPLGPREGDRAYVVHDRWVVFLANDKQCVRLDAYATPWMDESREAIRACRLRLGKPGPSP